VLSTIRRPCSCRLSSSRTTTPDTILVGIGPAWSLNVEVVFYLVLPVLAFGALALASRIGRLTAALLPVGALLVLGLIGKAIAAYAVPPTSPFNGYAYDWHSVVERSFLCHADLFAFGMALAVFRTLWADGRVRLRPGGGRRRRSSLA
jgi:peptidoglycan/LPS O-acetylase OafA/YrhL